MARVRLEPIYLMTVLKYIDYMDTLCTFHQVSHNTKQAIDSTKINPACGENSLELALSLGYPKMIKREMNAFTNIDTLHVNFREIEAIPLEKLQKYRLFEIYKWFMRYDDSKYPNFNAIKDKVSVFGVDCNYNHTVKVSEMNEIRELWIRISDSPVKTTVDEAWKAVHTLPNLRKLVVIFKSQYIDQVYENTCHLLGKIRVVYKCNNLDDNDVPQFRDFFNMVDVLSASSTSTSPSSTCWQEPGLQQHVHPSSLRLPPPPRFETLK